MVDPESRQRAKAVIAWGIGVVVLAFVVEWLIKGFHGAFQVVVDQAEAGKTLLDPVQKERPPNPFSPILAIAGMILLAWGARLWKQSEN